MRKLMDYLAPETMMAWREEDRQRALDTLTAYMAQADRFKGDVNRLPPAEVQTAYQQATGTPWPKAAAPANAGMDPRLANNMPTETLAVMRSPTESVSHEMSQKTIGEILANLAGRETMLEKEGDLPVRELERAAQVKRRQWPTMSELMRDTDPAGLYTPYDVNEAVGIPAPMTLSGAMKGRDQKLYPTSEGLLPAPDAIGKMPYEAPDRGAENVPPQVKQAQDFIKMLAPKLDPMSAMLISMNPQAALDGGIQQQLSGAVPPQLQPIYQAAIKVLENFYGVSTQAPAAPAVPDWRTYLPKAQ